MVRQRSNADLGYDSTYEYSNRHYSSQRYDNRSPMAQRDDYNYDESLYYGSNEDRLENFLDDDDDGVTDPPRFITLTSACDSIDLERQRRQRPQRLPERNGVTPSDESTLGPSSTSTSTTGAGITTTNAAAGGGGAIRPIQSPSGQLLQQRPPGPFQQSYAQPWMTYQQQLRPSQQQHGRVGYQQMQQVQNSQQQGADTAASTSASSSSLSSQQQGTSRAAGFERGYMVPASPPYEPYSPVYEPDTPDTPPEDAAAQDYAQQEINICASQFSIARELDIQWIQIRAGTRPLYENIFSGARQANQPDRFVPMGFAVEHEDDYEQRLQGLPKPQLDLFIPHTLELQDLEKLSSRESSKCPVCFEEYEVGQVVWYLPGCLHRMHQSCVQPWLETNHVCPECRDLVGTQNGSLARSKAPANEFEDP